MVQPAKTLIHYPDSDGKPMADNTDQFRWIVVIQQNLEWLFADDPLVFVAGDLLWYPVEGQPGICTAPDVLVAMSRPKGKRGSYQQWHEGNQPPQVVFEIRSPGNTQTELNKKQVFYDRHGVEEYYLYDPDDNDLSGWLRGSDELEVIESIDRWVSPRLGIRFERSAEELRLFCPDGEPFLSYVEVADQLERERSRADRAEERAVQAEIRVRQLEERLRQLGIDPNQIE